jgi:hypothetical protein
MILPEKKWNFFSKSCLLKYPHIPSPISPYFFEIFQRKFKKIFSSQNLQTIFQRKFMKIFERFWKERFSPIFLTNSFSNLFFLKSSKDLPTKMYENLQKNYISRRSYVKIFVRSHSAEDLKKDLGLLYWINNQKF